MLAHILALEKVLECLKLVMFLWGWNDDNLIIYSNHSFMWAGYCNRHDGFDVDFFMNYFYAFLILCAAFYFADETDKQNLIQAVFLWLPVFFIVKSAIKSIILL